MKKSELRKIIRESIKELINEQQGTGSCFAVYGRGCGMGHPTLAGGTKTTGGWIGGTHFSLVGGGTIQVGDILEGAGYSYDGTPIGPGNYGSVGRRLFVINVAPGNTQNCSMMNSVPPGPVSPWYQTECPWGCNIQGYWQQNTGATAGGNTPQGNAIAGCANLQTQPTTGCDPNAPFPPNFNLQSWTNTWTSLPNFSSSNPNQPCNFICQRRNQWTSQLAAGGMGPKQTNMVACRLEEANNQYQIHNCANSSANNCP